MTTTHATKIVTIANHGTKARRAVCSCGWKGGRSAFGAYAGRPISAATLDAERDATEHAAAHSA